MPAQEESDTDIPARTSAGPSIQDTSPADRTPDVSPSSESHPTDAKNDSVPSWDSSAVYNGNDIISYHGRRYRAKWWTQGEPPDTGDVWEDLGILDGEAVWPDGVANVPVDASVPGNTNVTDFKVVGYYPSWKPDRLASVDFGVVTHVCYAFAIPTKEGGLRELENPETASALVRAAHENGAKALLSVGGWSYQDVPLEPVFMEATADGNIYYDAAAHTDAVLNAVDFINVMAYDGGDGERHSPYQFAVDCGTYWNETRGLPARKVVLGVPFYSRPGWADYGTILESDPSAWSKDHTAFSGMEVHYNGVDTIARKTRYAKENLGGIMIWELTQDTSDPEQSLLQTIGENSP